MRLLLPGGGSWFDWAGQSSMSDAPEGHAGTDEPTAADVDEALEALRAGHVEYVILDADDGTFVQAAGSGDTGYQLEHWVDGAAASSLPSASLDDVRATFVAYLQGRAPAERLAGPGPGDEKPKRRWFGRG